MEMKFKYSDNMRRLVLVVDDEYVNRQLLGHILSEDYDVLYAENGKEALKIIRENRKLLSLVLLDLLMPEMNGFELMELLRADEELKKIPVIVLTSEESAEVKSLQLGAADFIKKPYDMPEVIQARVWRIIELSEDTNIIQAAEKDELTDLYTKNFFFEYAQQMERYHPNRTMDAVAMDIDQFHLVNELYGRSYGDRVLELIAGELKKFLIGTAGIGCRNEADTFFMYCAHQTDYRGLLQRISEGLSELSSTPHIRLRMGVYEKVDHQLLMEERFDRARLACNTLRSSYTKQVAYYDEKLHEESLFAQRLINDIHDALEQKQFQVYYQPKYNIQGDTPVLSSAEALIRWKHPEFGMVSPGVFIPLFEQNGLIQILDNYVWREAAAQIRAWKDKFGVTVPISVNVSRIDIYDPELEEKLADILEQNGLTTADMLLEITESAYAEDAKLLIEVVEDLRAYGFRIEMDDFGSGYSSLNMLSVLPIDVLKMDMSFVRNMHEDKTSFRLIELIMDIAEYLKVPVVAEGVEYEEQVQLLKKAGCAVIQGYYFSRPVPPNEFEEFISVAK